MLAPSLQLFSASAGSGKTYTLTLEYIKLSLHEVEPRGYFRRILAVTFTIKAAEEMRSRIIQALSGISAYPEFTGFTEKDKSDAIELLNRIQQDLSKQGIELSLDELSTRSLITLQQILQDYGLFSVMTIDAFVQRLSSSFVEELHLPSQFEVIMDIPSLMNDLMDQLLDKVNQSGDPVLTDLVLSFARQEVIDGRNWNRIRQSLIDFLRISFDENYFGIKHEMDAFSMSDFLQIELQLHTKIQAVEEQVGEISKQIMYLIDSIAIQDSDLTGGANGPIHTFRKFVQGQSFLESNKYVKLRNAIDQNKWHAAKVDPIAKSNIEVISDQLTDLAREFVELYDEEIFRYLLFKLIAKDLKKIALISSINQEYQVYQHEQSSISISEFARRINEIISQDPVPFIYEKLGDRYFHILIDEFQDTSILQWKNFMPLLENTVSLGKRNLLVGDAKQSIYKFRGGEVGLIASLTSQNPALIGDKIAQSEFDQVRFDYLIQQIQLNELAFNYRSAPEIVEFNNALFTWISNQPNYQSLCALLEPVYGHRMTQIPQVSTNKLSGQVDVLVFKKPVITSDNKDVEAKWMLQNVLNLIEYNVSKGFCLGDISLLTRKNKDAKFLALQLKEAGYPVISADSLLVYYSSLVSFILALLKMKVDSQKPLLLFEAAYALADIHGKEISLEALKFLQDQSKKADLQLVMNQYIQKFYGIQMNAIWEEDSLFDVVYHSIGIFDLFNQAEGSEYILKLLDIIQDFTLKNASTISDFLDYFDLNKHSFSISCPENVDAITITSIHKSKGLEYPVVILPFASWSHQAGERDKIWYKLDIEEEAFQLNEKGALPHFYARANANDVDAFPSLVIQKQQERDAIFLDALNMLYVASTRAKQHLHILFSEPNPDSHARTKTIFEQSIGKLLKDYLQYFKPEADDLPSFVEEEYHEHSAYYLISQSEKFITKPNLTNSEIHINLPLDAKTSRKPLLRVKSAQADLYTLAKEKRELGEIIHKQLENLKSFEDVQLKDVLPEIVELLEIDEIKQFFIPGELFISEEDILLPDGNVIRPDRVIKKKESLIVVDYKTGKKEEKHLTQVNSYCEALRKMGYVDVQGAIIYTVNKEVTYV
ncbi:UvrD-helicase domain-containing protein [Aquirufa aurantiipilula]